MSRFLQPLPRVVHIHLRWEELGENEVSPKDLVSFALPPVGCLVSAIPVGHLPLINVFGPFISGGQSKNFRRTIRTIEAVGSVTRVH